MQIILCVDTALTLAGCVSTASYQIISKQDGPKQTTIAVEVPATSTQGNMQTWADHLETIYKTNGKPLLIDFYANGGNANRIIGTYQGS